MGPGSWSCRALVATILLSMVLAAASARAHIAVSTRSLQALVAESDLIVRGRLIKALPGSPTELGSQGPSREILRFVVLEVLDAPPGLQVDRELEVVQHGHGVAPFARGQEALVFLRHLTKTRELRALAERGDLDWVSTQEQDEHYPLRTPGAARVLAATRAYVAAEAFPMPKRQERLRALTLQLLRSPEPRLARSALWDFVAAGDAFVLSAAEVDKLLAVVDDQDKEIGLRVGLLVELERRSVPQSGSHWVRLLHTASGADLVAVIAAAGQTSPLAVHAALTEILNGPDPVAASAAAVSLGRPGNAAAVPALSEVLQARSDRVAMAAVRGLARIQTPEALLALEAAAEQHPDERVRRRATAEVQLFGRR